MDLQFLMIFLNFDIFSGLGVLEIWPTCRIYCHHCWYLYSHSRTDRVWNRYSHANSSPGFGPDFGPDFWPGFGPGFLDQKRQCYSSTGTEKGHTLTSIVFLGPTQKTGYPLSTNTITKRYLFVNDYRVAWCWIMIIESDFEKSIIANIRYLLLTSPGLGEVLFFFDRKCRFSKQYDLYVCITSWRGLGVKNMVNIWRDQVFHVF